MTTATPAAVTLAAPATEFCLHDLIRFRACHTPEAPAILAPGRAALSYARLQAHLDETVARLNAFGLGRNDRVAVALPNGPEMATALLAVSSTAICAPLEPLGSAAHFDSLITSLGAKTLLIRAGIDSPILKVAWKRRMKVLELLPGKAEAGLFKLKGDKVFSPTPRVLAAPGDIALLLRTAGATGRPRLVPLTHRNLCSAAFNTGSSLQLLEGDRCLNVMPLHKAHGLIAALCSSLAAGASVVCAPGVASPAFWRWLVELHPTWYTASPGLQGAILRDAAENREAILRAPLRFIRSCDAALAPKILTALENVFHAPVIETYGTTETTHQIAASPVSRWLRKPGSVGLASGPSVAIMGSAGELLDRGRIGEIVVRGETVMNAYENNPQANETAFTHGWFRTGDKGYLDAGNYLFVTGRMRSACAGSEEKTRSHHTSDLPPLEQMAAGL